MNAIEFRDRLLKSSRWSPYSKIRLERMPVREALDRMLTEMRADDNAWRAEVAEMQQEPEAWEVEADRADEADDIGRRVRLYGEAL